VFSARWSVPRLYKASPLVARSDGRDRGVEFRSSMGIVVWPEVLEGIRLCQEELVCDFTCVVVQRYWKCVS
jgi:hypothetical protein